MKKLLSCALVLALLGAQLGRVLNLVFHRPWLVRVMIWFFSLALESSQVMSW